MTEHFYPDKVYIGYVGDKLAICNDEYAKEYRLVEPDTISVQWSVDDVQVVRPDLDSEKSMIVLNSCMDNFDADIGINWQVIKEMAFQLYPKR